jgi:hypothetical protein
VPGALLVYAGWSNGVIEPSLFGAPALAVGLFAFANAATSHLSLEAGVLTGRSLLGRIDVRVDEIKRIVPITVTWRRTFPIVWMPTIRMFDVCGSDGPTGLWLNPNRYGEAQIARLLGEIHLKPEVSVEDRVLDIFSRNRDYTQRNFR